MPYFKTVFEPGVVEPGLDNYVCPLRTILDQMEKTCPIVSTFEPGVFEPGMFREKNVLDNILKKMENV
ncbi:MAG: hypothetical protein WC325_12430 [Candidatus Bathyarchaeia archaeon]